MISGGWFRPVRWRIKMWISLGMLIQFYPLASPLLILFVMIAVIGLLAVCIIFVVLQGQHAASRERVQSQAGIRTLPVAAIRNDHFERWKPTTRQVRVRICECGKWNAMDESVCWSCQLFLTPSNTQTQVYTFGTAPSCAVCSYDVKPGDSISICPACQAQGHRIHMLEYLKAKGTCPVCGQLFQLSQLLEATPTATAPLNTPLSEPE